MPKTPKTFTTTIRLCPSTTTWLGKTALQIEKPSGTSISRSALLRGILSGVAAHFDFRECQSERDIARAIATRLQEQQPPHDTPAPRIRPLRQARDGHSFAEQEVYQYLWNSGQPNATDVLGRAARGGYRSIGLALGLDAKTVKRALHALEEKLSLERIPDSWSAMEATQWRVYSYQAIVARRKAAGVTHYVRNRGGITLWPGKLDGARTVLKDRGLIS